MTHRHMAAKRDDNNAGQMLKCAHFSFMAFLLACSAEVKLNVGLFAVSPSTRVRFPLADFGFGLKVSQGGESTVSHVSKHSLAVQI